MKMQKIHRRWLQVVLTALAILCIVYGMVRQNHPVFIVGILVGVAGYLLIRQELKESLKEKR
jgi:hypothetical protein